MSTVQGLGHHKAATPMLLRWHLPHGLCGLLSCFLHGVMLGLAAVLSKDGLPDRNLKFALVADEDFHLLHVRPEGVVHAEPEEDDARDEVEGELDVVGGCLAERRRIVEGDLQHRAGQDGGRQGERRVDDDDGSAEQPAVASDQRRDHDHVDARREEGVCVLELVARDLKPFQVDRHQRCSDERARQVEQGHDLDDGRVGVDLVEAARVVADGNDLDD
mmetsp:Transcript_44805/g.104657  ORF Transcript_44805/g.104657 Transcript_44805/m.104657 type:complete len:218 (+) Transcript_44805:689-1342(+)